MPEGSDVLRDARRKAHLTQTELASRAGVTQSVISAYEAGRRQPSLATLQSLVEATGFDLELKLAPTPSHLRGLTGPIGRRVRQRRRRLIAVVSRWGASNVRVFGSVARGDEHADSDLDLLIDLPATMGLIGLGHLREELEVLLECRVDLAQAADLKPAAFKRITADLVAL